MYRFVTLLLFLVSTNVGAYSKYWVDVSDKIPTDAKCNSGDSDVFVIDTDAKFTTANLNNATYTYFCVTPGVDGTDVSITANGTAGTPKVIRYWDNGAAETHPVHMVEANRATLDTIGFDGGDYWILDRITVHGTASGSIDLQPSLSTNIHLQRMLIENSGSGGGQVNNGSSNFVIQGSVVRDSDQTADSTDDHCVNLANGDDIKVVDNELFDCTGDMLQMHGQHQNQVLIASNELYVSTALRTDCSGNFTSTGACLAAENAMDFKTGGDDTFPYDVSLGNYVLVKENIMWGFDRDDDNSFVSGGGGDDTLIVHQTAKGISFDSNFIDGMGGDPTFGVVYANPTTENISFINNLFYNLDVAISGSLNSGENEYYYNTFLNVKEIFFGNEDTSHYACNVFVDVFDLIIASLGTGSVSSKNAFYNSDVTPFKNTDDIDRTSDTETQNEMFCYSKFNITNPTEVCVPLASTTKQSPHGDTCVADRLGETTRGIDNLEQLTRVRAGFVAPYLEETIIVAERADLTYQFVAPTAGTYQFWFKATTTDADDNSLSYSVSRNGVTLTTNQIVSFSHPATEWRKGKLNFNLEAGMHTITLVEREVGIVMEQVIITNNPEFENP